MSSLRILMLLVAVVICYLLFVHNNPPMAKSASGELNGAASTDPVAHSQYKQAMDKAHNAAKQMQEQRADADAP